MQEADLDEDEALSFAEFEHVISKAPDFVKYVLLETVKSLGVIITFNHACYGLGFKRCVDFFCCLVFIIYLCNNIIPNCPNIFSMSHYTIRQPCVLFVVLTCIFLSQTNPDCPSSGVCGTL